MALLLFLPYHFFLKTPDGKPVQPDIVDNGDGTYKISYVPKDVGPHTVTVKYGGDNAGKSPYQVKVVPTGDASKCSIIGRYPLTPSTK